MTEYYVKPWFTKEELDCKCGCGIKPTGKFLDMLGKARFLYGRGMTVTGKLRCREEQMKINPKVPVTDHEGWGLDVRRPATGRELRFLVLALEEAGFNRIGFYDKHIHFGAHPNLPPDVWWIGVSK